MTAQAEILITGGTGFLGQAVAMRLPRARAIGSKDLDLTDRGAVLDAFGAWNPQVVIHLAGLVGGITANMAKPADFMIDNMQMGMNVLEAARRSKPKHLIVALSTCMYPDRLADDEYPMSEDQIEDGAPPPTNAGYAMAKRALLSGAHALHQQYDVPYTALIPANLYGPGDHFGSDNSHFLAASIERIERARHEEQPEVTFFGTGVALRQYVYVDDVARLIADLCSHDPLNAALNVAPQSNHTIRQLAECVAHESGYQGEVVFSGKGPDGQFRKDVDSARLRKAVPEYLSYETQLADGVRTTLEWYRNHVEAR